MADLSFAYDRAGRLTTVTDITLPATPKTLKTFVYGTSNAVGVRNNGKLQTGTRYNYVGSPFNATVQVVQTYTYGGRQGRVSQKTTLNVLGRFDPSDKGPLALQSGAVHRVARVLAWEQEVPEGERSDDVERPSVPQTQATPWLELERFLAGDSGVNL